MVNDAKDGDLVSENVPETAASPGTSDPYAVFTADTHDRIVFNVGDAPPNAGKGVKEGFLSYDFSPKNVRSDLEKFNREDNPAGGFLDLTAAIIKKKVRANNMVSSRIIDANNCEVRGEYFLDRTISKYSISGSNQQDKALILLKYIAQGDPSIEVFLKRANVRESHLPGTLKWLERFIAAGWRDVPAARSNGHTSQGVDVSEDSSPKQDQGSQADTSGSPPPAHDESQSSAEAFEQGTSSGQGESVAEDDSSEHPEPNFVLLPEEVEKPQSDSSEHSSEDSSGNSVEDSSSPFIEMHQVGVTKDGKEVWEPDTRSQDSSTQTSPQIPQEKTTSGTSSGTEPNGSPAAPASSPAAGASSTVPAPKKSATLSSSMTSAGIIPPKKLDDHLLDMTHAHPEGSMGGMLYRKMIDRRRKLRDRFVSVTKGPSKAAHAPAASENPKGEPSEKPASPEAAAKEKPAAGKEEAKADATKKH